MVEQSMDERNEVVDEKQVRTAWDAEQEKWFFSITTLSLR